MPSSGMRKWSSSAKIRFILWLIFSFLLTVASARAVAAWIFGVMDDRLWLALAMIEFSFIVALFYHGMVGDIWVFGPRSLPHQEATSPTSATRKGSTFTQHQKNTRRQPGIFAIVNPVIRLPLQTEGGSNVTNKQFIPQ